MAILDINKNSLPEQVQENKENIAAIQTAMDDKASTTYVDEKDADTLQDAKDYADGKDADTLQDAKDYADGKVPKSIFTQRAGIIAGYAAGDPREIPAPDDAAGSFLRLYGTNDNKGIGWFPGIKKSDIDSESATAGQVLQADGNGGAEWANPSGGNGWTLVWSGSKTLAGGTAISASLEYGKNYIFEFSVVNENRVCYSNIVKRFNGSSTNVFALTTANSSIMAITFDISTALNYSNVQKYDIAGSALTNNVIISAIYEV